MARCGSVGAVSTADSTADSTATDQVIDDILSLRRAAGAVILITYRGDW